jgi:hypothetical protein
LLAWIGSKYRGFDVVSVVESMIKAGFRQIEKEKCAGFKTVCQGFPLF